MYETVVVVALGAHTATPRATQGQGYGDYTARKRTRPDGCKSTKDGKKNGVAAKEIGWSESCSF